MLAEDERVSNQHRTPFPEHQQSDVASHSDSFTGQQPRGPLEEIAWLAADDEVAAALEQATGAVNQVHRRPVNLRKVNITSSTAALRSATLSARLEGLSEQESLSAYSLCAPELIGTTTRTFVRAPLQVIARIDALAGGTGQPLQGQQGLLELAKVIVEGTNSQRVPSGVVSAWVHARLLALDPFAQRSGTVARVAARLVAVSGGFDPRSLCVPEVFWHRHAAQYSNEIDAWRTAAPLTERSAFIASHLRAYTAGAAEAEGIAAEVKEHS